MDSGVSSSWGLDWAWGLPLIVLTVLLHAHGLGAIGKEVHAKLIKPGSQPEIVVLFDIHNWRNGSFGHHFARIRGCYLGRGLSPSWGFARRQVGNALFAECPDELRPRKSLSVAWLGNDGGLRGVKRLDSIWT